MAFNLSGIKGPLVSFEKDGLEQGILIGEKGIQEFDFPGTLPVGGEISGITC